MSAPLAREARGPALELALRSALAPSFLELLDESHKHRGHAGAADGRSHFALRVVSEQFAGLRPLARHRLVYAALGSLMETDVHALAIAAWAPGEPDAPG